ncbi:3-methyl-2-oxobutanoate hydroxymethyltransferase [Gracilibacillus sp. YIM 98692]|uniref:3-methyl-2-oxobutanoate hydroxymethyltransferase n=1 Tax=Gracilibacillus sp. YIM 98692 TaxID=2663532 RepID=UPI0013D1CE05|nr:3-methyl-2-oxobutanoate hydroxymethyltransferase [Gracilibacillus sp. YIM 98692]
MLNTVKLKQMKKQGEKIAMLTAYDYPSAKLAEKAKVDMILVGDSLGNVVLGYDSTIEVTVDDMIHHAKAVTRGAKETFVVVDMPFMSYHISLEDAMKTAQLMIQQTNAQSIKVEGASDITLELVKRLTDAGVPVVGHLGLTPQSVHVLGGYRIQGKDKETAMKLIEDAYKLEKSGAVSVVLECVPDKLAEYITNKLDISTIGIGAGKGCDGQVLVYHDILQYGVNFTPSFVKSYSDLNNLVSNALVEYTNEVKSGSFPEASHSFSLEESVAKELKLEE